MARTVAGLPAGARITDYISLGAVARWIPLGHIKAVLKRLGRQSQRQRQLPAHVMVYYVVALALYMEVSYGEVLRSLVEGLEWIGLPVRRIRSTGPSGISQARTRLGSEPLEVLYEELVAPVAVETTRGAWYRGLRLISLDGTTLDIADEKANDEVFGRPTAVRGRSGYPQLRFVSLLECGTHVLFGAQHGPYATSEIELARRAISRLDSGMLCLADRHFFSFALWGQAADTGAELLWRMKINADLPCHTRLEDGSYLSKIYSCAKDRRHERRGVMVRVIEYAIDGVEGAEPLYRLLTTILDPALAPAQELAALYHERWEGVLRLPTGSLRDPRDHARSGAESRSRSRRAVLRPCRPSRQTQDSHRQFFSPLRTNHGSMNVSSKRFSKSDAGPVEAGKTHGQSSER